MNILPLLGGAGIALFSVHMFRYALGNFHKASASLHWPTTPGKLTKVYLWGTRRINDEMKPVEKLSVEYEYRVRDQTHLGTVVSFYTQHYPETVDFAQSHPVDSDISVHYNPDRPTESVLIPGRRKAKPYSDLIIGACGIILGSTVAVLGWLGEIG